MRDTTEPPRAPGPATNTEPSTVVPCTRREVVTRWIVPAAAVLAVWALPVSTLRAHGGKAHEKKEPARKEQMDWGIAGDAKDATRRVEVGMGDDMRFTPAHIEVRLGETVRFIVRNSGRQMHEFVIGTRAENVKHAELMIKFPSMEHDEPYIAHVAPGKTREIVWAFNRPGEFEFACLIAGHYLAGMVGTIKVAPAQTPSHPRLERKEQP
jgi:uncharacterized cupredoxin-like copper-binding protein